MGRMPIPPQNGDRLFLLVPVSSEALLPFVLVDLGFSFFSTTGHWVLFSDKDEKVQSAILSRN
jgi:hypothetical protein